MLDSQPLALEVFAEQRNLQHQVGQHILSGASLNYIVAEPDEISVAPVPEFGIYTQALPNHEWDFVTFQPYPRGNNPDTPEVGPSDLTTDVASILELIDLTQANPANSDTKFYIYSAWPRYLGYRESWTASTVNVDTTRTEHSLDYYSHLLSRVREATEAEVYLIPVGEVLFELDTRIRAGEVPNVQSLSSFFRNLVHLRLDIGRYLASTTTFTTLFGLDPFGQTKPVNFFGGEAAFSPALFDVIHDTVRHVVARHPDSGVTLPIPTTTDFNFDGIVNGADFNEWEESFGVELFADANFDGQINGADFLEWQRSFGTVAEPTTSLADLDGDGVVGIEDLQRWEVNFDTSTGGDSGGSDFLTWQRELTPIDVADFNHDYGVDAQDLAIWDPSFGQHLRGDADKNRVVDGADFLAWQREFGLLSLLPAMEAPASSVQAVPEPTSLAIYLMALLGFCRVARGHL